LDIQLLHHPIRTMLVRVALEFANRNRSIINEERLDVTAWMEIWKSIQPDSNDMWASNKGCRVGGRNYLRHILALKALIDVLAS